MRCITKQTISIEILADDGISAGTMIGKFYADELRIESMKIKREYLTADLLRQSVFAMVDVGLIRGAKCITWCYTEPLGVDYTDKKNDPYYLAVFPMMIFRPELELTREPSSGEYYINFSELPQKLWHDRYTPERLDALGIQFLPVESLTEYYSQFDEIVSSDREAETSRIMVINGELAGWCLSMELSEDVARISPVYVVKKFRPKRTGVIMEGHVMNILKQKYSGIRLYYDKKQDAHLIQFYSFYFGKAFTETARIFRLEIKLRS